MSHLNISSSNVYLLSAILPCSAQPGSAFVMPRWCEGCSRVPAVLNKPLLQAK